jgi:hypothetical protein
MHAELSSLASTIAAAKVRITEIAERLDPTRAADLLTALHEVERSLGGVHRQLERAVRLARTGDH